MKEKEEKERIKMEKQLERLKMDMEKGDDVTPKPTVMKEPEFKKPIISLYAKDDEERDEEIEGNEIKWNFLIIEWFLFSFEDYQEQNEEKAFEEFVNSSVKRI